MWKKWRRRNRRQSRPQFGSLKHADGSTTALMYVPYGSDGTMFVPVLLSGENVSTILKPTDTIFVDVLLPGQNVVLLFRPGEGSQL